MSKAWKRTFLLVGIFAIIISALILIPLQVLGLLPYALNYNKNKSRAEASFSTLTQADQYLVTTALGKRGYRAVTGPMGGLIKSTDVLIQGFKAMGVETYGTDLPKSSFDFAKHFDPWEKALSDVTYADLQKPPSLESLTYASFGYSLLYKAVLAQWNQTPLDERIRRVGILVDLPDRLGPFGSWMVPDIAALLARLVEDSCMDDRQFERVKQLVSKWKPETNPLVHTFLWGYRRDKSVDAYDKLINYSDVFSNEKRSYIVIKLPFFQSALKSRTAEVVYQANQELAANKDDYRAQFVTLVAISNLERSSKLVDNGGDILAGGGLSVTLSALKNVQQVGAKRVLDQAVAAVDSYRTNRNWPSSLPLRGKVSLNPFSGRPIEYKPSTAMLTVGIRMIFDPPIPSALRGGPTEYNFNLKNLRTPNRFEVRLKIPATK